MSTDFRSALARFVLAVSLITSVAGCVQVQSDAPASGSSVPSAARICCATDG
jgi:uncharacterized membrane protein